MRVNQPVTQCEHHFDAAAIIVSTTDAQGRITHCNRAFVEISGYDYDELLGAPHSLLRHPDMPPEAFKDMWATIGRGRPWTGIVKNRRKNGDHYWVKAHVTPILAHGKPVAYMSVRFKPAVAEVKAAEALYQQIAAERTSGRATVRLHAGRVRRVGWRDLPARVHRLTISQRLLAGLLSIVGSMLVAPWALPAAGWLAPALAGGIASAAVLAWFDRGVQRPLLAAERFAGDIASCNLTEAIEQLHPHPMSNLTRALEQIQINLRAVVGDAREEVDHTMAALTGITQGSAALAERTDAQAAALRQTEAAMQALAGTVQQTADTAGIVARETDQTAQAAATGSRAVEAVGSTISAIESSSQQVASIVQVIEGIAFQTNILALNAAVEAARAGDEGRGFAVVAGEVRSLSQRSAASAKDIRELIHTVVGQVAEGAGRMGAASSTIGQTAEAVRCVGELVQKITRATVEQSAGIDQVNRAVDELDRVTQANAQLVRETVDVTQALGKRSQALKRSVQVYRS